MVIGYTSHEICISYSIEMCICDIFVSKITDNDNIDMNTMREKEFKSTHLEDGWDDNLIHDDELESLASEKSNKKSTTYKVSY